jgi:tetraacyldisaccharide 4'-kinase
LPLSGIYALVVYVRNKLFDLKVLKSFKFDIPIICVGNISVGGAGKTPHVEYLLDVLKDYRVAVLSRGYRRKTKGFRYVEPTDKASDTGDEALQIKRKFPSVPVAVNVRREEAINRLKKDWPDLQAILLDDALQYRRVIPSLNIVIIDYNRPAWNDFPLPLGRLRDLRSRLESADMIILSKCPENLSDKEKDAIKEKLRRRFGGEIYFSFVKFGEEKPVFDLDFGRFDATESLDTAFAGIANPKSFFEEIKRRYGGKIKTQTFADHHNFTEGETRRMAERADRGLRMITTEKDAARLRAFADFFSDNAKSKISFLPLSVAIIKDEYKFKNKIIKHVQQNKINGGLSEG